MPEEGGTAQTPKHQKTVLTSNVEGHSRTEAASLPGVMNGLPLPIDIRSEVFCLTRTQLRPHLALLSTDGKLLQVWSNHGGQHQLAEFSELSREWDGIVLFESFCMSSTRTSYELSNIECPWVELWSHNTLIQSTLVCSLNYPSHTK